MTHIEDEWRALRESIKKTEISNFIQRETRIERLIGENRKVIDEKEEMEQKYYLELKALKKEKEDNEKRMLKQIQHHLVEAKTWQDMYEDEEYRNRQTPDTLLKKKPVDK